MARRVAALSAQPSQFAGARTRHDKPCYARRVVRVYPARLQHKAAAASVDAPGDMVQTDKTRIAVAAIGHQLLADRLACDTSSERLCHYRVCHFGSWNFIPRFAVPGLLV